MKFQWVLLLPSLLGILLFSSPAEAAKLLRWRFDSDRNRLEFTTDDGVQPKAQLFTNPTRLIVDLPGTTIERPIVNQLTNGAIRTVRVGQLNPQTARIVVELAPGYTIDPKQVQVQVASSGEWSVQLPDAERIAPSSRITPSSAVIAVPRASTSSGASPSFPAETSASTSRLATIQSVEFSNNQLLIRANQQIRATSRWNARENTYQMTIPNAQLAERLRGPQLDSRSPVSQVILRQQDSRTVLILVKPSADTRVGELNQVTDQLLALQLRPTRPTVPPTSTIPVPPPTRTTPSGPLPSVPRGRVVVLIDPGHGGPDPGAVGIGGLREKDIVLPISQQVATILERQGVQALMTRADDSDVSLEARVQMAQRARANLFVSIHANSLSASRPDVSGVETYYFSSQRFAQTIHNSIVQSLDVRDRGVRRARFYVLRNTSMPSVLLEVGFVTGAEDARKLSSPAFQRQMAEAIARGILLYLQQNF